MKGHILLFSLVAILIVACGTSDPDVLPAAEPVAAPEQEVAPPELLPVAPVATPEPEPEVAPEPEPTPVVESGAQQQLNAEGLPMTEARAKASEYYKNPGTGFGFLSVTSDPPRAAVTMGSERIGMTPIARWRGQVQMYLLRVDLPGYDTFSTNVYLKDNQTINVTVNLTALVRGESGMTISSRTGMLQITANVEDATIFVDNKYYDTAPRTIELSPGTHEVKVRKLGYREEVRTVTITTGRTTTLQINMHAT